MTELVQHHEPLIERTASEITFGLIEADLATDDATRSAAPTRSLAPSNSGSRILEMIMRQIPCMRPTCALRPD